MNSVAIETEPIALNHLKFRPRPLSLDPIGSSDHSDGSLMLKGWRGIAVQIPTTKAKVELLSTFGRRRVSFISRFTGTKFFPSVSSFPRLSVRLKEKVILSLADSIFSNVLMSRTFTSIDRIVRVSSGLAST